MKQVSFLILSLLLATTTFSQEQGRPKRITLKVKLMDSIQRVEYGYLAAMADSGIVMLKSPVIFDQHLSSNTASLVPYQNITQITVRRKGSVGRGILIGGLSGMFLGGVIGYISYKPVNCEGTWFCMDFGPGYDAATGASIGTLAGAAIGGIIGAVAKKTWTIGGNKNRFHEMRSNVIDMTYGKK